MVHTVSGIVLHRLYRMMRTGDAPRESARVVSAMVARVRELDPAFFERVGEGPLAEDEVVERALPVAGRKRRGDAEAARLDALLGSADLAARRLHGARRGDDGGSGARGARVDASETLCDDGRPGAGSQPVPEPLSAGDAPALRPLAARAGAAPLDLHVPEEALPHRGQPGPAASHGARLAAAHDPHRHRAARLRHAAARRREPPRSARSTRRPWSGPGRPRTACSRWACPSRRRSTCCPTRRPCASTRAAASSTSRTSG